MFAPKKMRSAGQRNCSVSGPSAVAVEPRVREDHRLAGQQVPGRDAGRELRLESVS